MSVQNQASTASPAYSSFQSPLSDKWVVLSLLSLYLIWGTTYLAVRFALESFPPYLLMGIRFVIAGGGMYVFSRLRGIPAPTRKQWVSAAIVGMLLLFLGMGNVATAEQWISSGLAATLIATAPLWAILFSRMFGAKPTRNEWIGVSLGVVGVALLSLEGNLQANPKGVLLILFATGCWSFGSILMSRLDMPQGVMGSAAEMLTGGAMLCLAGILSGQRITETPTLNATLAIIYLTLFGSLVTISAYMYLLKTVSPSLATSYSFVNPVIALVLGALLADEKLTGMAFIALPVILLGLGFIAKSKPASD